MRFSLYDYRSFFADLEFERNFYNSCKKKLGNFEEEYLEENADSFIKMDWYFISYFANVSERFIIAFKDELDPCLINSNKKLDLEIKNRVVTVFSGTNSLYMLQNKRKKISVRCLPAQWNKI
jgi:hypothetical protein